LNEFRKDEEGGDMKEGGEYVWMYGYVVDVQS
jgi:hypothetical protein